MSGETQTQQVTTQEATPVTSAETVNTEQTAATQEHMIPKSRFDEVNTELKKLRAEQAKIAKEREQAEATAAAEQGKYKELWEQEQAKSIAAEAKAKTLELSLLRQKVATKYNVPAKLVDRLIGETEEEIETDAKALMAELPKSTPNVETDAGKGVNGGSQPTPVDEEAWRQEAIRLGVSPEPYIQTRKQQKLKGK